MAYAFTSEIARHAKIFHEDGSSAISLMASINLLCDQWETNRPTYIKVKSELVILPPQHLLKVFGVGDRIRAHIAANSRGPINEVYASRLLGAKIKKVPGRKSDLHDTPDLPRVVVNARDRSATIDGKPKRLNTKQYDLISALVASRPLGKTKDGIEGIHTDARGILRRLAKKDPDWARVIHMAQVTSGRYRID